MTSDGRPPGGRAPDPGVRPLPPSAAPPVSLAGTRRGRRAYRRRRRRRRLARVTAAVVVVAGVAAAAVALVGKVNRSAGDSGSAPSGLAVPSTPPPALLGRPANLAALGQNSSWSSLASQVARGSTASFASVYGPYPPQQIPTHGTFLVVAGEVRGGNHDIAGLLRQEVGGVRSSFVHQPGAKVTVGSRQPSVAGGQVQCASADLPRAIVGECLWLDPQALVQVVTFTDDFHTVEGMTTRVVEHLQAGGTP